MLKNIIVFSQYNVYYGNIHSHTSFSDGVSTPSRAFIYAKDTAHLHFLAITDHVELLTQEEFEEIKDAADSCTINEQFIGIAGYEWSSPTAGHCNVFNVSSLIVPSNTDLTGWYNFWQWNTFTNKIKQFENAIVQFNHPGDVTGDNEFNSYIYIDTNIDNKFMLMEIHNQNHLMHYIKALNKGWHVSPTANQDNHEATWGTLNELRTGIWAADLTYSNIIEALTKGRTFATWDNNSRILIEVNGIPMGQKVPKTFDNYKLRILIEDDDEIQWHSIKIYSNKLIIDSFQCYSNILDTIIDLDVNEINWVFVTACQNNDKCIVSAPVYFTPKPYIKSNDYINFFDIIYYKIEDNKYIQVIINNWQSVDDLFCIIITPTGKNLFSRKIYNDMDIITLPKELSAGIYYCQLMKNNIVIKTKKLCIY